MLLSAFGGPENLSWGHTENVPSEPGPGKIIIQVKASAINRADTLQRKGVYPPPKGESEILGLEAAGVVHKVGPGCSRFAVGDRVMALVPGGGNAQFAIVNENHTMKVPENLSFEDAAAIPEVWITAFQMLFVVADKFASSLSLDASSPKSAVVHAGASGVGTALIQLLKAVNVTCYVTAGSDDKIKYCQSLGATGGFNYKNSSEKPWDEQLLEHEPQGVNIILDPVGGNYFGQNVKCLKVDGSLVLYGLLGGNKVEGPFLGPILGKRLNIHGTTLRTRSDEYKCNLISRFEKEFVPMFATGQLKPIVDRVLPISQIKEAHELMESNTTVGKIVLSVPH